MTKRLLITIDGRQYDVLVEVLDTPAATAVPVPAPAPAAPAPKVAGPGDVPAPLAGRVVEVLVKPGQAVKENEHVVTLEAMKMNTNILAPRAGTVAEVKVVVGDAVAENQVLVTLA